MIMQISSGMGPIECRAAVGGIFRALKKEYPDIQQITCNKGEAEEIYSSIIFSSDQDLSYLQGTMEWICKSKFRPSHKRKNWFVDVSIIPEADEVYEKISPDDITIESYRSGGPGGQHVNKIESEVRITHLPTGITVTSTKERSQYMNKQDALRKLSAILKNANIASRDSQKAVAWAKHAQIQRGNPVRIYEGERFLLKKTIIV